MFIQVDNEAKKRIYKKMPPSFVKRSYSLTKSCCFYSIQNTMLITDKRMYTPCMVTYILC